MRLLHLIVLLFPLVLLNAACVADVDDESELADDSLDDSGLDDKADRLSGACSSNFASCVRSGGGAACASRWCSGQCVSAVASCVSGGGGASCSNRCSGAACQPQEVWTEVWTWECGFPYGWGGQNAAAPGKARATCTQQCNGQVNNCRIWHYSNGRAQCTLGVPLDAAQNPW